VRSHRGDAALVFDDQPSGPKRTAARLPILAALGVQALVLGSLFAGLREGGILGELTGDGALPGTVLIVLSAILSGAVIDVRGARAILLYVPLAVCILLSYVVNADEIRNAHFLGRDGQGKFLTSLMVLGLYLTLFYSYFCLMAVYGVAPLLRAAGRAAMFAAWLLILEISVEVASWFSPGLRQVWLSVRTHWTFSRSAELYRLNGFAPEPSFTGIITLALLGLMGAQWVGAGARKAMLAGRAPLTVATMAALLGFQLIANARTFAAGALGVAVAWILVAGPAKRLPAAVKSATITLAPLAVQAVAIWSVNMGGPGTRSVSNITRSIGMLTATDLWRQHPLLGLGLGQYGFHFRDFVPSWGLQSWEIAKFFRDSQLGLNDGLPPSFSIFSRLGAEIGLVGFLAWILPPFYAMRRAMIWSPGPITSLMVCAFAAQFWTGLSLDSFRNVYYWLWLAALFALVRPSRARALSGAGRRRRELPGSNPAETSPTDVSPSSTKFVP
jgi:hypothetical protein